jgi:hypothetical protein
MALMKRISIRVPLAFENKSIRWIPIILSISFLVTAIGCTPTPAQTPPETSDKMTKVGQELLALYDEYSAHLASRKGEKFQSANPLVRLVEDRVVIDATASGEATVLKADLLALGMQRAVAFGRIVSGELPIRSIPAMGRLESLNFARAASNTLNSPGDSGNSIPQRRWSLTGKPVAPSITPVGRNPEQEPPAKAGARVEGS